MAIVTFTVDGVEHWTDENSKAYEKYLASEGSEGKAEPEDKPVQPAPRVPEEKPVTVKVAGKLEA